MSEMEMHGHICPLQNLYIFYAETTLLRATCLKLLTIGLETIYRPCQHEESMGLRFSHYLKVKTNAYLIYVRSHSILQAI
jgi:hypothetical protein